MSVYATIQPGLRLPYPMRTLSAPNGVTNMAGAKAYAAKFATSPMTTKSCQMLQSCSPVMNPCIRVMMPPHHIGLFKYWNPSPSKPCLSLASLRPFFVMTKLVPMASVEVIARARPTYLSSTISALDHGYVLLGFLDVKGPEALRLQQRPL